MVGMTDTHGEATPDRRKLLLGAAAAAVGVAVGAVRPDVPLVGTATDPGGGVAPVLDEGGTISVDQLPPGVANDGIEVDARVAGMRATTAADETRSIASDNSRILAECLDRLAARGGGRVRIPGAEGDYVLATTIALPSNTALVGDGALVSRLRLRDGAEGSAEFVRAAGRTNVRVSGLGFDGGAQSSATVSVSLDGAKHVWIERCSFRNMKRAISVFNSLGEGGPVPHHVYIRDNRFLDGIDDFAVRVVNDVEGPNPHDIWIHGNTVDGVKTVISAGDTSAFRIAGTRVHVTANIVKATDDTAIMFAGNCRDCTAVGNTVTSTMVSIFCGSGSRRTRIADNSCTSLTDYGLHVFNPDEYPAVSYTTVTGNVFTSCGKAGIRLEGVVGVSVTGNQVVDPAGVIAPGDADHEASGIMIGNSYPAGTNVSSQVVITGNVIVDTRVSKRMQYGIYAADAIVDGGAASPSLVLWPNSIRGATTASVLLPAEAPSAARAGRGGFWVTPGDDRPRWSDGRAWRFGDGSPAE
jgi:hypothetical protein